MRLWSVVSGGIIRETGRQIDNSANDAATRTMLALRSLGDTDDRQYSLRSKL